MTLAIEAITSFSSSPSATISTVALVGTPKDITPTYRRIKPQEIKLLKHAVTKVK